MSKTDEFFDITGAAAEPTAAAPRDPNVEVDFDVFGVGDEAEAGTGADPAIDITGGAAGDFTDTAILPHVEAPTGALDFELDGEPATTPLEPDEEDDLPERPAPAAPPAAISEPAASGGGSGMWIAIAAAVVAIAAAAVFLL